MKQCSRDLVVINYRFHGLVGKICKTQKQCSQIRKSLGLDLKKITGGAGLKRCNLLGGFMKNKQDTKKTTRITDFSKD
jgi:hypothetical protein